MKLYLIELNECDYDQFAGFIIVAKSGREAIKYLKEEYPEDSGWNPNAEWSKGYKLKEIKPENYKKIKVLLASFNAG